MENFYKNLLKSVDNVVFVVYNRGINNKRKEIMENQVDKSLENKNLSEAEKRALEIAKECGIKRIF